MKQALSILAGIVLAASAFGESLDTLTMTVSTKGPDRYADESLVLEGETYLLVYVKEDATFGGVTTEGKLLDTEDNLLVTQGAAIAGARCGMLAIQYPATLYPSAGKWALVLLDTRNANGVGGLVVGVSEVTEGVNLAVVKNSLTPAGLSAQAGPDEGLTVTRRAKMPEGTPTPIPVISSIEPTADGAKIRVANIASTVPYDVETTTDLVNGGWSVPNKGRSLQVATHGVSGGSEIAATVTTPPAGTRFFRVVVNAE